jgi:hypothetical protein
VYLLNSDGPREGPYIIASVISASECILAFEDGKAVNNGQKIGMDHVEAV